MRCLGIDPGFGRTGFALVEEDMRGRLKLLEAGCIRTEPNTPMPMRLLLIFNEISSLIQRSGEIDVMSVERLYYKKNITTGIAVAQARGIVLLLAAINAFPIVEPSPVEIKKALSGYGGADKGQMQRLTAMLLSLEKPLTPDDTADAAAAAIAGLGLFRAARLTNKAGVSYC